MKQLIGIQGEKGSFHEQAAVQFFGASVNMVHAATFSELFELLSSGSISKAVVAIANNRYNFIPAPYAMLCSQEGKDFWITGETYVHVQHQLLGSKSANLSTIKEVHSQAPAFGQCMNYLNTKLAHVPLVEQDDTAQSAKLVSRLNDPSKVAIASKQAGRLYGLKVLAANIQDDKHNYTRFMILQRRNDTKKLKGNKTTILLQTAQNAGSLADVLSLFKEQNISIDTLHSSYLPNSKFTMQFFMEFNEGIHKENVMTILNKLVHEQNCIVTVLGTYYSGKVPMSTLKKRPGELYI